jgi:hypothetical protein
VCVGTALSKKSKLIIHIAVSKKEVYELSVFHNNEGFILFALQAYHEFSV